MCLPVWKIGKFTFLSTIKGLAGPQMSFGMVKKQSEKINPSHRNYPCSDSAFR
jgi:hypothetical protein